MESLGKFISGRVLSDDFDFTTDHGPAVLKEILPRLHDVDFVEHNRLGMVAFHIDQLIDIGNDGPKRREHIASLGHLGASKVLDYLPER